MNRYIVTHGGVRAPGGLPRLQSGWDGRSPSGGFDSRPPPPTALDSKTLKRKSANSEKITSYGHGRCTDSNSSEKAIGLLNQKSIEIEKQS